jgi:D-alanine-D-alanine ligase
MEVATSMDATNEPVKKFRVGIFFGGKSTEHEVSLQSAKSVFAALDKHLFDPVLIGIDKAGGWHVQEVSSRLDAHAFGTLSGGTGYSLSALLPGNGELVDAGSSRATKIIDVALPILHGPLGEDGTIQGLFELANIPYVGPGVLGSAVGMDKDVMKRLLRDAAIPIAPFRVVTFANKNSIDAQAIFKELGSTVFVKPANMGSSVGVSRARNEQELLDAVQLAFCYDTKIIIEKAIEGDEIECAVLGNENPRASVIGSVTPPTGDFYSYEAKYVDEKGSVLTIPAKIPTKISEQARKLAIKTYQTLSCEGMGRVDMFVTKDQKVLVNEINTIPGFTKNSMYPKLWEATGMPYSKLITELIHLAMARHARRQSLKTTYDKP